MASIICSLVQTMEYLQPGAFAKDGKEICQNLNNANSEQVFCIFTPPSAFTQCGYSATAMFNYGMDNKLMGKQVQPSSDWCPSNGSSSSSICTYHPSCAFSYSSNW
jgi:hypothetical protein